MLAALNQLANATVTPPTTEHLFRRELSRHLGMVQPVHQCRHQLSRRRPSRSATSSTPARRRARRRQREARDGRLLPARRGSAPPSQTSGREASIVAHENVLNRMSAPAASSAHAGAAWPTDTYFDEFHKLPEYFNGEAVIIYHAPAANTDGDSFVFFRHSEVISAGNLFSTVSYPVIDVAKGGTIQGVIDGLNQILDLAVAEYRSQGGTWVIPGRGRLSDTADVASYRNMVTMIRDRVQDMKSKGMTLEQVKAARPTMDFDGRYGSTTGAWTTEMFVEAVYRQLSRRRNNAQSWLTS